MDELFKNYELAKNAFDSGNYEEARTVFEKFIKENHDFADVYNYLAYIYYLDDDREKSIEFYKKSVAINPSYTEALMNLVLVLHEIGDADQAQKYMNQLKSIQYYEGVADKHCLGKLSNMHAETARAYLSLFWYEEAINEFEKALKLNPEFPDIRLEYAIALRDYGKVEESIYEFDQVIISKPVYTEAYVQQGIAFYKLGFLGFALESWKKGYELDSSNKLLKTFIYLLDGAMEVS